MNEHPNVKKDPYSNEENLCWAAACSNVLTYTGWLDKCVFDDELALYLYFKEIAGNTTQTIMAGFNLFFSNILGCKYNLRDSIQLVYPRFITMCEKMEKNGQAAILGITKKPDRQHVLTCYDIIKSAAEKYDNSDPRRYSYATYVDSDDNEGIGTLFLTYNTQKHATTVEYRDEAWDLYCLAVVSPPTGNPGSV